MSSPLAIAAVTSALRTLLETALKKMDINTKVTIQPPDKAQAEANALNLFLYHVGINPALRNNPELPGFRRPGESGPPPLALDLFYLISVYGHSSSDVYDNFSHRLVGRAMTTLHDHTILEKAELASALQDAQLHNQVERIRITPHPLGVEEMSKLWTTFQTNYRLSVAYQVSAVLIESEKPSVSPLPVLSIGPGERGVSVEANMQPPLPVLMSLGLPPWANKPVPSNYPSQRPSLVMGESLSLVGFNLDGSQRKVIFSHPQLSVPNELLPDPGASSQSWKVTLPSQAVDMPNWLAGIFTVNLSFNRLGKIILTNSLPLILAPKITNRTPASTNQPDFTLELEFQPQAHDKQHIRLLFGSQEISPEQFIGKVGKLSFKIKNALPGSYPLRLRIDGAESLVIYFSGDPLHPGFDPNQVVLVTL